MKNIAVIGCGYWGQNLVRNFNKLQVLHSICDSDASRKSQYSGIDFTTSHKEIFGNPAIKAVAIATPAAVHFALAKEALLAGKDVFVEKPIALKFKEGETLVDIAEKKKKILMVDHILHYHPAVIKLKEMIRSGDLGAIQYIYSNRLNIGKFRKEENILWSFAPHDISLILALAGKMPQSVVAFGEAYLQKEIYDSTLTTLVFGDKMKAHIFVSWLHPFKEQKLVVIGTKNMAVFDDQAEHKLVMYPHKVKWVEGIPVADKAEHHPVTLSKEEPLEATCRHFIECIECRKQPLTNGREALNVLKVLNEAQKSLERN